MKFIRRSMNQNLRNSLMIRCALLIFLMTLAMGGLFGIMRRENSTLLEMLEYEMIYNDYFSEISHLRASLLTYMNTADPKDASFCNDLAEQCVQKIEKLGEYYDHPQFEDQRQIAFSLQEELEAFLSFEDVSLMQEYKQVDHIIELILDSDLLLSRTERALIEENIYAFSKKQTIRTISLSVFIVAIFILGLMLSYRIADRMVRPIEQLTQQVQKAEEEFLSYIPEQGNDFNQADEVIVLSRAFYNMIHTLQEQAREQNKHMEMERKLEELKFQNMQIKVYLAQSKLCITQSLIHPHFLFNCLNIISSMEYLEGATHSREVTQLIAVFLRDAIARVGNIVSMKEELQSVERYIKIQKLRFGERIKYDIQTEENCLQAQIPAMALQPIVENALVHGISDCRKDGHIVLKIWERSGRVYVQVLDDGQGVPLEKIASIKKMLNEEIFEDGNQHVGLMSTISLLKSCFHENFHFNIQSEFEKYTCVELNFPLLLKKYEDSKSTIS